MNQLKIKNLGLAFGLTASILYIGCTVLMLTIGHDGTVNFFNSLLHGLDVSTIIRMNVPLSEAFLGVVQTFILAWLIGACIALFYNTSDKS